MLTLIIVANTALAILTSVFIVKEILINFKESKNRIKNICIFFLAAVSLFLPFVMGRGAFYMSLHRDGLENDLINADKTEIIGIGPEYKNDIQNQLDNLKKDENNLVVFTILGYISYGSMVILNKNIVKEIKIKKPEGKWDFNKL